VQIGPIPQSDIDTAFIGEGFFTSGDGPAA
jgi:hypothetical protein